MTTPMDPDNAQSEFNEATQIAIVCGAISGGLELIDFDLKNLPENEREDFWDHFQSELLEISPDLLRQMQINKTQSGGYHMMYRCTTVGNNVKLAKMRDENGKLQTIIETRGEGGYFIAPPSPGYTCIFGNMDAIANITPQERDALLSLCKSFDKEPPKIQAEPKKIKRTIDSAFKQSPFEAYNESDDILTILKEHGWTEVFTQGKRTFFRRPGSENTQSANWHHEKKVFYVFSTGDQFLEGGKAYNSSQIFNILISKGDWKLTYRALAEAGYGTRWSESDWETIRKAKSLVSSGTDKEAVIETIKRDRPDWMDSVITKALLVTDIDENEFWFYNRAGNIDINPLPFIDFLSKTLGYALYSDSSEPKKPLIKINKELHQVERIASNDQVKHDVEAWLRENLDETSITAEEIIQSLMKKHDKLFSDKMYEWLPSVSFNTFSDNKNTAFFFFKNGIVEVQKASIRLMEYESLPVNTYIWRDRIKCDNFDVEIMDNLKDDIYLESSMYKFLRRVSAVLPDMDETPIEKLDQDKQRRLLNTMTSIGYMLHSYKDPAKPWALIVQEDTPVDGMGGGSGKQLIIKCMAQLRNLMEEDGKLLDPTKQFAFQGITEGTDIFVLDDAKKHFKLEPMYRMITNDMVVEIRNVGRKIITYDKSPKILITTNYDLTGTDNAKHLARRIKILLVHCYFGPERAPKDELGMLMTDDWDYTQWNLFYNLMFRCTAAFLHRGVVEIETTNAMREKSVRQGFGDDFFEFMQEIVKTQYDEWLVASSIHDEFVDTYKLDKRAFSYSRFRKGMDSFFEKFSINVKYDKDYRDKSMEAITRYGKIIDRQLAIFIEKDSKRPFLPQNEGERGGVENEFSPQFSPSNSPSAPF